MEENPEFAAMDPAMLDEGEEERVRVSDYGRVIVPDKEDLIKATRCLDEDQRKVLDIAIKFARGVEKARCKGRRGPDPPHLMVHGTAGTGDSFTFKYLIYLSSMRYLEYLIEI